MTTIQARLADISHYQPLITKALITTHRLKGVAAKCTQSNDFSDSHYATNHSRCRSWGVPFWAYHFAEPGGPSAAAQAKYFLDHAKLKAGDGILLDLEASSVGQTATRTWRNAFLTYCRARVPKGTPIHIYMGGGYCTNGTGRNAAAYADHLWFPHYTVTGWASKWAPGYPSSGQKNTGFTPSVWQCSDRPGFDHDVSRVTVNELRAGGSPAPSPTGDDDMPEYVSLGISKPYELAAGHSVHVPFDVEHDDKDNQHAKGAYPGILTNASKFEITVELDGLVGTWQLVMSEKKDGKYVETRQYAEQDQMQRTLTGSLAKGEHLYLRANPTANCHVAKANVRCLYWKA